MRSLPGARSRFRFECAGISPLGDDLAIVVSPSMAIDDEGTYSIVADESLTEAGPTLTQT